jgi:RNA polymerase sigma-70 factor (ECF subfamily)
MAVTAAEALLAACAAGDERALGSLYDRYAGAAYGLALRVLRDAALAEDAVQEAFLGVWRHAARFDPARGTASTWILTLVHRRAVDLVRRQAHADALPTKLEAATVWAAASDDADVEQRETQRAVRAALTALPSADREILALAYWRGLTQREIATELGIPHGTVKSRTYAALARLREEMSETLEPVPSR